MFSASDWQQCKKKTFWKDIAPEDHVVQIYEDDSMLLNILTEYAADGFYCGDSVIVIATTEHLDHFNKRLKILGLDRETLINSDRYIPLDAAETLSKFMVNGSPDEKYFLETVGPIVDRARKSGLQVRSFGEMVALLWEHGNNIGTIQLEHLWNKFCQSERMSLFCAYPKSGFSQDAGASVMHICSAHAKVIGPDVNEPLEMQYRSAG